MSHNVTLNNNLLKQSRKTSSRNNHYYESNLDINQQIKTCNEFIKIYLIKQAKKRLIINRFRLFKFRRKKIFKKIVLNYLIHHIILIIIIMNKLIKKFLK